MRHAYFPGCSLHSTATEYDQSARWVCRRLGVEIFEIPDWNCCGATSAHAVDHFLSVALPARNLVLAEQMGAHILIAPCAACYNRMKTADATLKDDPELARQVNATLPQPYGGSLQVMSLLEALANDQWIATIKEKVVRPLEGLKVASYYGCLLLRPPKLTGFDDPENPRSMDTLMAAIGAEPVEWPYKTECCGASFALSRRDLVLKMTGDVLSMAKRAGANAIATACPLCQANLDTRQDAIAALRKEELGIPIYYFTELLALALGAHQHDLALEKHFVKAEL